MSNFFMDYWQAQKESFSIMCGLMREHPVGFSTLILATMIIPFIPYVYCRIKVEKEHEKLLKELQK